MRKKRKEERETKIFSVILVVSVLIIAGLLIFSNWKMAQKRKELLTKIEDLKREIEILDTRNQQLKKGVFEIEEESFLEPKIREQGYKKPGETAVVIKEEQKPEEIQVPPQSIWEKFLAQMKGLINY